MTQPTISDEDEDGLKIWERLESEVEELKIKAAVAAELESPSNLWSTAKAGAYTDCLDLIRSAKNRYERYCY